MLVVDENPQAPWYARNVLSQAGFTPIVTWDPEEAERLFATEKPCLVLLDIGLQGADSSGLMQRIRDMADVPVVFLSGQGRDREVALAFEMGADDYIVKPFSPTELAARAGAALRRQEAEREAPREPFRLGDLVIDYAQRRVTVGGRALVLTETEYRLLYELSVNPGRVLSRDYLMSRVWAAREDGHPQVVRAYLRRLRRKLGESASNPRYIFSKSRAGYWLGEAAGGLKAKRRRPSDGTLGKNRKGSMVQFACAADGDSGAGVRSDQGEPGLSAVPAAGRGEGQLGVAPGMRQTLAAAGRQLSVSCVCGAYSCSRKGKLLM